MWHLLSVGDRVIEEYETSGNGGQYVMVFPELDLAVAFTGGSYGNYRAWRRVRDELVPMYVLPAVRQLASPVIRLSASKLLGHGRLLSYETLIQE